MKITVIGTGYVGLVTGACLADAGNTVFCLDLDEGKINRLNKGEIPIFEPGLEPIVRRNEAAGRLKFSTDIAASVAHGEIQVIAVGTPPSEDGSADMQHVISAARNVGRHMDGYKVVVTKSTVPVGTADRVKQAIIEEQKKRGRGNDFTVVSNPEFLKEGAAAERAGGRQAAAPDARGRGSQRRAEARPRRENPQASRQAAGQDDRAVGSRVQGQYRRHARSRESDPDRRPDPRRREGPGL